MHRVKESQEDEGQAFLVEETKRLWWSPSSPLRERNMNVDDNEAERREVQSSTPVLPRIHAGYDTPDSDYNYEVIKLEKISSVDASERIAVLTEPRTDASSVQTSSVASSSSYGSYGKDSRHTESIKNNGTHTNYSHSERSSVQPRHNKITTSDTGSQRRGSDASSHLSSSQRSYKDFKSSEFSDYSVLDNQTGYQSIPTPSKSAVYNNRHKECGKKSKSRKNTKASVNVHDKSKDNVIRSCTYAEGFRKHKEEATLFPMVNQNERGSKSAKELGLAFDEGFATPIIASPKGSARFRDAEISDRCVLESPFKFSLAESKSVTRQSNHEKHKTAWCPARLTPERYNDIKENLLNRGKFKDLLRKYWGLDIQDRINRPDSDDDGYDTDLDANLGLELIADEKSREVKEDGEYPEYKHNCRRFKSTPNSYFMRHSLEDDLRMRYRYLNKGDSVSISTQMKNHLTMSEVDLKDNSIGPCGMNFFKHMLKENKRLTELNLSCNNLGPEGARYLKHALRSNCFLLKLNVSKNNFGEKGGKHCAGLIEENVSIQEMNISRNSIGDYGAIVISKALADNVSLKCLDISWNNIGREGGVKLCDCLKKNTELEIFRAHTNGFGDDGGKALINSLRTNQMLKEVDLSNNRLTDVFIKLLTHNLTCLEWMTVLKIARNNFQPKPIFDFLAGIMTAQTSLTHLDIEGIQVTEEFKGLANAVKVVQDVTVAYKDPPSKRDWVTDVLTRNLVVLCEFLEDHELEVEDLYPDYEEMEEESDKIPMFTVGEVITKLQETGHITRPEKINRLMSKLELSSRRKFHISELALVYDKVICGKDIFREKPLRSHLRRSIKEERAEKEKKANQKPVRIRQAALTPSDDLGMKKF